MANDNFQRNLRHVNAFNRRQQDGDPAITDSVLLGVVEEMLVHLPPPTAQEPQVALREALAITRALVTTSCRREVLEAEEAV